MGIGISKQEASHIATDRERWRNTICKVGCQSERTSSKSKVSLSGYRPAETDGLLSHTETVL